MVVKPVKHTVGKKQGTTRLESVISVSLLFLLVVIAILIYFQQFIYDEAKFDATVIQAGITASPSDRKPGTPLSGLCPENFLPMTETEHFDRDTLSDKINGKADVYLEAGFKELTSGRFVHSSDANLWFEFFLYDMDTPTNAFSVYSTQKRGGVTSLDVTRLAYATGNAVFFAHGPYYVEIIAADQNDVLLTAMEKMAGNFINRHSADRLEMAEVSYFPAHNLDPGSISMILHNAFGFEKLNNVFTGDYHVEGMRITAFLSVRATPHEAKALATAYADFLADLMESAPLPPETEQVPEIKIMDIFDEYEMVFAAGNILAGIHASADKAAGEELASQLYDNITRQLK